MKEYLVKGRKRNTMFLLPDPEICDPIKFNRYCIMTEWRFIMSATVVMNIRLPEDLLKTLKYRAIEEKKSVNQIIREAIEMSLAASPQPEEREKDPFEDVIGIARSGIKDASSKHDLYLYFPFY
jgi:hypothetical protein